ncbi:MAG: hypothetical protein M0Z46_12795 [Actinomycetota bacterium]|nr:hypothetical protein [Actinomycetota bacterium]
MTDRIAELRELTRAATPGPWRPTTPDPTVLDLLAESWSSANGEEVADFPGASWPQGPAWVDCTDTGLFFDPADAALIVAMRNALPALLDVVEAARDLGLETVCLLSPPCGWCGACALKAALARLSGEETSR